MQFKLCLFVAAAALTAATLDFNLPREWKPDSLASPAKPGAIRIVSWNIDRGSHLSTLSEELTRNPADILLLQEVDWNATRSGRTDVALDLARQLHLNMAYGIEFQELSQQQNGQPAYIGQATLSRFPIRKTRVLRFERQSGFWKPHAWMPSSIPLMQRRLGSRIALVTDLDCDGTPLVVYNLHLESRSMGLIQAAQLDEVLADLKKYPPNTPAIIGGDLNSKYLPSIFLHKLEREGFSSALGQKIERTHAIAMALDWIFVRGPYDWQRGVVRREMKGSDHYPIYADLIRK